MINYYKDLKKDIRPKKKWREQRLWPSIFLNLSQLFCVHKGFYWILAFVSLPFFWLALVIERDFLTFKPSSWKNFQPWPQGLAHCDHFFFQKKAIRITRLFSLWQKKFLSSIYFENLSNTAKILKMKKI